MEVGGEAQLELAAVALRGKSRRKILRVGRMDRKPLLHDLRELGKDFRLDVAMAAAADQRRGAPHEAAILRAPFHDLHRRPSRAWQTGRAANSSLRRITLSRRPFAIVDFEDFFEGMLHLFLLIRLKAASLTAKQSDLNMPYRKQS